VHTTARYASTLAFMSLVLSGEFGVLFSPCDVCTEMRRVLRSGEYDNIRFWIGICLVTSMFLTFLTLLSTFTAWAIISSISDSNACCILRSSIGLHASGLPSKMTVLALYTCLSWMILFMLTLVPIVWGIVLAVIAIFIFFHIITVYSSLGKLIMYTGAMGSRPIFGRTRPNEEQLQPFEIHKELLMKAKKTRAKNREESLCNQYEEDASDGSSLRDNLTPSASGRARISKYYRQSQRTITVEDGVDVSEPQDQGPFKENP